MKRRLTSYINLFSKKTGTVHKVLAANKNARAMASDPRHDMRYNLRAKISQKDYVDKAMKQFHYASGSNVIMNGVPFNGQQDCLSAANAGLTPAQFAHMQQLQQ